MSMPDEEDRVRHFRTPLTLDECQERLLSGFAQSGHRVYGTVAWQEFRAWKAPRFGLGTSSLVTGEIRPDSQGSRIDLRIGKLQPFGMATRAAAAIWAVLWLIWIAALLLWLLGPADVGIGPGRLLILLVVNLGMGATYLIGRRLDREDPEALVHFIREALEATEVSSEARDDC